MASGINKVILVGNLGADPEVRYSQSGTAVANLRLAVSERRKGQDGNWADHTEWVRTVCFGKTADNVGNYLKKGRQVYVEGRLQTRKWTNKEGQDQYTTEVVANQVLFLGSGSGEGRSNYSNNKPDGFSGGNNAAPSAGGGGGDDFYDDVPF